MTLLGKDMLAERAACQTFAVDFGALNAFHFKLDDAVVHRYGVAGLQVLVEILIIDADLRLVPCHVLGGKGKAVPRFHFHLTGSKCSDAVLRAFGVQHDGDGQPQLLTYPLDQLDFPLVFGMGAVGKVQPGHIHAGLTHAGQGLLIRTDRANGAYNFGFSHGKQTPLSRRGALVFWLFLHCYRSIESPVFQENQTFQTALKARPSRVFFCGKHIRLSLL